MAWFCILTRQLCLLYSGIACCLHQITLLILMSSIWELAGWLVAGSLLHDAYTAWSRPSVPEAPHVLEVPPMCAKQNIFLLVVFELFVAVVDGDDC